MIYNEHIISNKPIYIIFSVRDKAYSAAIMQEDDTELNKFRSLAFVGKILPDVQRRYLPPELSFTCMGDILKRYAYMLLGKEVHLYTNEYWKELDDPWQYLHKRIQKPLLRIREFGAQIHTVNQRMSKMYEYLQTFPILGEEELNKLPKEYTIADRLTDQEMRDAEQWKLEYINYFGVEPSKELIRKIKNIEDDQSFNPKIKSDRKKYPDQFHVSNV